MTYTSHNGQTADLYGEWAWVPNLTDIRGGKWTYTLGTRGITGASRPAVESKFTVNSTNPEQLDGMQALFDRDVQQLTPGMLTINGEWSQRALIVGRDVQSPTPSPDLVIVAFTVILCDGTWSRTLPTQHFYPVSSGTNSQLDLPTDLPTDLAASRIALLVSNPSILPAEFVATIFGPCTNPSFTVGSNSYEFEDLTVPIGGYVRLTATGLEKSIRLVTENGDETDAFSHGVRGSGAGGGRYIFEPMPVGNNLLTVSGNFGLDIDLYEKGDVPWSTLS